MIDLIAQCGFALIFANVLVTQLGAPFPVMPTLVLAGAFAAEGRVSAPAILCAALIACAIGDTVWYVAGRLHGARVLRLLCRLSLATDHCVRESQRRFERWGRPSLVVAKFVPGLSLMMPSLAGSMHIPYLTFALLDGLGAALWVCAALELGALFHQQIGSIVVRLQDFEETALIVFVAALAGYVSITWWRRQ